MKKSIYRAYTRVINRKTHYFVKKYDTFTGLDNIPPILDSMGMHIDFIRACELASVENESVMHDLMEELNLTKVSGKVIPIQSLQKEQTPKVASIWYPQYWLSKLKWAHI